MHIDECIAKLEGLVLPDGYRLEVDMSYSYLSAELNVIKELTGERYRLGSLSYTKSTGQNVRFNDSLTATSYALEDGSDFSSDSELYKLILFKINNLIKKDDLTIKKGLEDVRSYLVDNDFSDTGDGVVFINSIANLQLIIIVSSTDSLYKVTFYHKALGDDDVYVSNELKSDEFIQTIKHYYNQLEGYGRLKKAQDDVLRAVYKGIVGSSD